MKRLVTSILAASVALCMAAGSQTALSVGAESAREYNVKDVVTYGSYNGTDLKWEIVAKNGEKATLFLKDVLRDGTNNPDGDMLLKRFNDKDVGEGSENQNKWLNSPIRTFLNSDFYNDAFSAEQKEAIVDVDYSYPGYSAEDSKRQGETVENPFAGESKNSCKVFLPTYGDISSWYESVEDRALQNTDLWWWTRSPVYVVEGSVNPSNGGERQLVWYAHEGGENRAPVTYYLALRPVIVVDTTKFVAKLATSDITGTVNAGAKVTLFRGDTKIAETTADADGKYSFTAVESGNYEIEVSLDGYTAQRVNVTVGSTNVVKDVTLVASGGEQPKDDPDEKPQKTGLSGGAIAGIAIACVAALAAVGIGVSMALTKKKSDKKD